MYNFKHNKYKNMQSFNDEVTYLLVVISPRCNTRLVHASTNFFLWTQPCVSNVAKNIINTCFLKQL